jgi:hypothetical protein
LFAGDDPSSWTVARVKRWAQEELQLPEEVAKSFGNSLREEDVTGEGLASFIVKHKLHLLLIKLWIQNTDTTQSAGAGQVNFIGIEPRRSAKK